MLEKFEWLLQMQKLLLFFSKYISIYVILNDTLTNDIVSFEQMGPGFS